jgi:Fe-S cluster assembly protein SufD
MTGGAFALPDRREPAWLREARERALAAFRAQGLPTTRMEAWRFTNLAPLAPVAQAPARPLEVARGSELLAQAQHGDGPRLVFANGRHRAELALRAGLPPGTFLGSLAEALQELPEVVRAHLGLLAKDDGHPFVALNAALSEDAAVLVLPAGAAVEAPIEIHWVTDAPGAGAAAHPRLLVVAGPGARAAVGEIFTGHADGAYLTNAVAELALGEGSEVEHYRIQDEAEQGFHLAVTGVRQGAGARLSSHALALGAALSRSEIHARHEGEGAAIALTGLYMASGRQLVDVHSLVEHAAPRCQTLESYKGILDGHAKGVFAGRIRVLQGAQKTNAYQSNSNLLLSQDAVVDTMPQLEIFADDVKCGHGGTVGQLDEAALFYLRSRGVPEASARALLIYAFAGEMVDRVRPPALRARARALVAARLPAGARLLEAA